MRKCDEKCDFSKKWHKYFGISQKSSTFAPDFKKSPAKSGFASAKSEFSAFGLH
jgi:hypothetical protein